MAQSRQTVTQYQYDNSRFAENGFIDAINLKYQKITFCGVEAQQQNGIVENKNKNMSTGARTLLLHGMRIWPPMIDGILCLFAMKVIAERLNSLQIYHKGRTPKSSLHGFNVEDIPVKSFHTLFIPIYVLDDRPQNYGGAGPHKWEPNSHIGVYIGHSPFHARSVAPIWNPTTGPFSPQYHLVFDNEFSTVPYMEADTIPPNWGNLVKHSSEMATAQYVDFADTWLRVQSNKGAPYPISESFPFVNAHRKRKKTNTLGSASTNKYILISVLEGVKLN